MSPTLKSMCSSNVSEHLCARSQVQVISVVENQSNAKRFDLLCREPFDGGLGSNGHKCREHGGSIWATVLVPAHDCINALTRKFHSRDSRSRDWTLREYLKLHSGCHVVEAQQYNLNPQVCLFEG